MLLTWPLILYLCLRLSTAETICNPRVPPQSLPSFGSCNYAIRKLEALGEQCGTLPIIWTAAPAGPAAVHLPIMFTGQGPGYTPPTHIWCTILVLWQPRPDAALPPPTLADIFPFSAVLYAARNIRDICLMDWPWSPPMLGREWMLPNEWIDVQLGYVIGPSNTEDRYESGTPGGEMTVYLADGSNKTIVAPAVNASHNTCETLVRLGGGLLRTSD